MTTRARCALGLLVAIASACSKGEAPPKPDPSSAPAVKDALSPVDASETIGPPPPALRDDVVVSKPAAGLTTLARLFLHEITPSDPVGVLLTWGDADGKPLTSDGTWGSKNFDWRNSPAQLTVKVRRDGGAWRSQSTVADRLREPAMTSLAAISRSIWIDQRGIGTFDGKTTLAWAKPFELFPTPGTYTVRVAGQLKFDHGPVRFETADLKVEVVAASDSFQSLAQLEAIAGREVYQRRDTTPRRAKGTIEDVDKNRVFRLRLGDVNFNRETLAEVVVAPDGAVRSVRKEHVFLCVAEGTDVDTPDGPRPIEALMPGQLIWGYDVDTNERVLTTIRHVIGPRTGQTLALGSRLRLTPSHPVYSDGRWVPAGELRTGARLLTSDLTPLTLDTVTRVDAPAQVFDLIVDWPHNFFAGGLLVHNKLGPTGKGRQIIDDTWTSIGYRPDPGASMPDDDAPPSEND